MDGPRENISGCQVGAPFVVVLRGIEMRGESHQDSKQPFNCVNGVLICIESKQLIDLLVNVQYRFVNRFSRR